MTMKTLSKLVAASVLLASPVFAQDEITRCTEDTQTCKNYNQLIEDYYDVLDVAENSDQSLLMCLLGVDDYYDLDNTQALGTAKRKSPIAACIKTNKRQNKRLKKALKVCGNRCRKI